MIANPEQPDQGRPHPDFGPTQAPAFLLSGVAFALAGMDNCDEESPTSFSRLPKAARDLIVDAVLGKYDEKPPDYIPPDVQAEIERWCGEPDDQA